MAAINEEIGRLVRNLLMTEQPVFLPGIGSLYVERAAARRVSASVVEPPFRYVEFASAERGAALPSEIARAAHCSAEEAADVYRRWLDKSFDDASGRLTIEGVGTLFQKSFRLDPAFDRLLNPQGRQPVRLRRPMPWWLWSAVTLLIVFLAAAGVFWLDPVSRWPGLFTSEPKPIEVIVKQSGELRQPTLPAEPAAEPGGGQPAGEEVGEGGGTAVPASDTVQPARSAAAERPAAGEIVRTRSGWSYVVLGIYSTESNARRAVGQAENRYGRVTAGECRIFRYGEKFLVSLGEAESREEAQSLAARYRAEGVADVWVYSKR